MTHHICHENLCTLYQVSTFLWVAVLLLGQMQHRWSGQKDGTGSEPGHNNLDKSVVFSLLTDTVDLICRCRWCTSRWGIHYNGETQYWHLHNVLGNILCTPAVWPCILRRASGSCAALCSSENLQTDMHRQMRTELFYKLLRIMAV